MIKRGIKWGIRGEKSGKSGGKWGKVEKWSGGWKKSACSNLRFSTLKCYSGFLPGGARNPLFATVSRLLNAILTPS